MTSLTQFFCVPHGSKYKLFLNTIYDSIDVLWPIENIIPREQSIKMIGATSRKITIIRAWDGDEYEEVTWDYTGSSMKIYIPSKSISITCPIISMSPADKDKLPFNSCSFTASSETFCDEVDKTIYPVAKVYLRDPYSGHSLAMASPVPMASPVSNPMSKLPIHVSKLVLADSISKNEACPISCDPITQENATVTSCGHVFTTEAINHWLSLASSKGLCPVCKQRC